MHSNKAITRFLQSKGAGITLGKETFVVNADRNQAEIKNRLFRWGCTLINQHKLEFTYPPKESI